MSPNFETSIPFHHHKRRAKTPSFSSILLDAIYRSIDDDHNLDHGGRCYSQTTPTSPTHCIIKPTNNVAVDSSSLFQQRKTKLRNDCTLETVDLRRAIMIESWIDKQQNHQQIQSLDQTVRILRQKSVPDRVRISYDIDNNNDSNNNNNNLSSSCFTNLARDKQSSLRIFTKTKSRAKKIYGELRKSRSSQNTHPSSPGRRIAAFLTSIFRNPSNNNSPPQNPPTTASNSTCSTASSFSRSCLSNKTSSSSGKSPRSVRFYPVSVILDEDSRPCGHKKLVTPRAFNGDVEQQQKWRREKEIDALMMMMKENCGDKVCRRVSSFEDEEEEDDDNGSCASSDLFELENLSSVGVVSRYYEELPVYGTTNLKHITT